MKLSIIIPVYNEEQTIRRLLLQIDGLALFAEKEVIIINDGSTDNTHDIISTFINHKHIYKYSVFKNNKGKGAAIKYALRYVTGDYIIIQDADLEYNPDDYNHLIREVQINKSDIVYGSRFLNHKIYTSGYRLHKVINKVLTGFSNVCSCWSLSDMMTCYKLIRTDIMHHIEITENGFGIEAELTAKISQFDNVKVSEVPIHYNGRQRNLKKIDWKDGLWTLICIVKYNYFLKSRNQLVLHTA